MEARIHYPQLLLLQHRRHVYYLTPLAGSEPGGVRRGKYGYLPPPSECIAKPCFVMPAWIAR